MNNLILTALLSLGFIALFYRLVIRRLLSDVVRDRICAQNQELEKLAESCQADRNEFCYQFLHKTLKIRNVLPDISISAFIHFLSIRIQRGDTEGLADVKRFMTEAQLPLRRIFSETGKDVALWMAFNSPVYSLIGMVIMAGMILFRAADAQLIKLQAAMFVECEIRARAC